MRDAARVANTYLCGIARAFVLRRRLGCLVFARRVLACRARWRWLRLATLGTDFRRAHKNKMNNRTQKRF